MTQGLLLGREPVLWLEALRAILPVAVLFGLPLSPEQTAGLLLAWSAVLALITRSAVTPNGDVAERVQGGSIVAGPANDREANGALVRNVGQKTQAERDQAVADAPPPEDDGPLGDQDEDISALVDPQPGNSRAPIV